MLYAFINPTNKQRLVGINRCGVAYRYS